jgi:hypothetical protein
MSDVQGNIIAELARLRSLTNTTAQNLRRIAGELAAMAAAGDRVRLACANAAYWLEQRSAHYQELGKVTIAAELAQQAAQLRMALGLEEATHVEKG